MDQELEIVERPTARVIVFDPEDRVLLFRANLGRSVDPIRYPNTIGFWALPGGGIEEGECAERAARRELAEETGLKAAGPLPLVAQRDVTFAWNGRQIHTLERFFFARTQSSALDTSGWLEGDRRWMSELGWWPLPKLAATREPVRPPLLYDLALELSRGVLPAAPWILPER
ncbi:MAG: NUDIX hydrolase [Hyphomicrobiaceae bacterium]